ncbi:MAG: hypothetical protein PVH31_04500, partial [Ectothiorhodospiraceae bacterium]
MALVKPPTPSRKPSHLDDTWREYNRRESVVAKDPTNPAAYRRLRRAYDDYARRLREVESH